jgi:hypothetical protein
MLRQPTAQQLSYLSSQAQIERYVQRALRDRDQIGSTYWDGGTPEMLDTDHVVMIRSRGDVNVTIRAVWFRDPSGYQYAIVAAIETALAA